MLFVCLQRFEHSKKSKKISTYIPFPQQLDMAPFMASRWVTLQQYILMWLKYFKYQLIQTDRWTYWQTGKLTDRLIQLLTDWLSDYLTWWPIVSLLVWLTDWLTNWFIFFEDWMEMLITVSPPSHVMRSKFSFTLLESCGCIWRD